MDKLKLKPSGKPFEISKWVVLGGMGEGQGQQGRAGVDGRSHRGVRGRSEEQSLQDLESDVLGSYFPPPVRAVEIPKPHGDGVRVLGVPTVADRVAQTVVATQLEREVEPIFHPDSYGYRPARSALDAVGACRARCWKYDWVIDLDIQKFFDSVPWDLVVKAVEAHTDRRGCCCMSSGGCTRRCSSPTAR